MTSRSGCCSLARITSYNVCYTKLLRAAVSIIKIYQQMIQIGSEVGYPRDVAETPYEYLTTLIKLWPDHKQEVQLITRAYVKVRYGEFPETKEEFETIKSAWERVQKTAVLPAVGE